MSTKWGGCIYDYYENISQFSVIAAIVCMNICQFWTTLTIDMKQNNLVMTGCGLENWSRIPGGTEIFCILTKNQQFFSIAKMART
jgi:hypothetical protein